jgi:predicted ABC-type ATPase
MPNLFVMAGPNGAGKTTTSRLILTGERRVAEFVNADIIAAEQGLSEIAAGRAMLQRLDELTAQRADLAFETTLSSASLRGRIAAMRDLGYVFYLFYVWIPSPEMSLQRVAARVAAGGHSIPEDVIRRRYPRSLSNFFNTYMPIADAWTMLDNSDRGRTDTIARREIGGTIAIEKPGLWNELERQYMKPTDKAGEERKPTAPRFTMQDIAAAADRAAREAVERHRTLGQRIVFWRDGKVVVLKPEEIDV